jgi:hypothetical protein
VLQERRSGPRHRGRLDTTNQRQDNPGTVLAATDALRWRRGGLWTDAEVAYLIHLAYETGRLHGYSEDMAELVGTWQEHAPPPRFTREQRIAERLAETERLYGPPRYRGGPVAWEAA